MNGRVQGKIALVTGAARGQGRSHAVRLAEEGADIIAIDICANLDEAGYSGATEADLDETARQVRNLGRRVVTGKVDVRDYQSLRDNLDRAVAKFGHLDIVCANAGIGSIAGLAHEASEPVWNQTISINLTGVWHTAIAAIPHIIAGRQGGAVVLTSSVAGLKGYANVAAYSAAKHGVVGLMRSLALELAPHKVRVNSVHPTQVDTPMLMNEAIFRLFRPDLLNPGRDDFESASQAINALPVPWVDPVDVSNAVLFLVSDEARYITGVPFPVDAGALVR